MSSLSASYTSASPSSAHTLTHALPALPDETSIPARTAYLAALQAGARALQDDVNTFLTAKMEEDKAQGAEKSADAKEELNYGEEVV